ncbi:hypothetical protein MSC49_21330 [Methylosinus sp. C49]|jgi:hypothetical protein|uniref:hypothetical protein n=1 Tax=Methylosinus sp. C49 TaxID=2699395 RepID=UPI0013670CF9|nr:hypothetical protein [Methylosinus sp. C49]BBU62198.1 hypothetical protein MSC49_21330 [Methylosinus sp. C49]
MRRGGQRGVCVTTWLAHVVGCLLLLSIAVGILVERAEFATKAEGFDLVTPDELCSPRASDGAPAGPAEHHRNCAVCLGCDRGDAPTQAFAEASVAVFPTRAISGGLREPRPAGPSRWARPWSSRAPPHA